MAKAANEVYTVIIVRTDDSAVFHTTGTKCI